MIRKAAFGDKFLDAFKKGRNGEPDPSSITPSGREDGTHAGSDGGTEIEDPSAASQRIWNAHENVPADTLDRMTRLVNLGGDALLFGAGAGLTWGVLRHLANRVGYYRMAKQVLNDPYVANTYQEKRITLPRQHLNIVKTSADEGTINSVSPTKQDVSKLSPGELDNTLILLGENDNSLAEIAARHPFVAGSVLALGIPTLLRSGTYLGKRVVDRIAPCDIPLPDLSKERQAAQQRYNAAARALVDVAARRHRVKQSGFGRYALGGLGSILAAAGLLHFLQNKEVAGTRPESWDVPDSVALAALVGGAGLLSVPVSRFVGSAREGYHNTHRKFSDTQRSAQAWEALKKLRGSTYDTPYVVLGDPTPSETSDYPDTINTNLRT